MSTFMDRIAIDLHPGHDLTSVLAAMRESPLGDVDHLWVDSPCVGRSRLRICLCTNVAEVLISDVVFAMAGEHIARILVDSDRDEFGLEKVVLANRQGRLVRTRHWAFGTDGVLDFAYFAVDEGLACELREIEMPESDEPPSATYPDRVLDGPRSRARTAELYGVEVAALESRDWWRALGVEKPLE